MRWARCMCARHGARWAGRRVKPSLSQAQNKRKKRRETAAECGSADVRVRCRFSLSLSDIVIASDTACSIQGPGAGLCILHYPLLYLGLAVYTVLCL